MVRVSSWGRLSEDEHRVCYINDNKLHLFSADKGEKFLPFGMGRSYGDQCLNPQAVLLNTTKMDRFISFDQSTGILKCESGVLLKDIQQSFVSRGWMLAVSPGTELITLGGAIANDVHGKNHCAAGSFGHHLISLTLLRSNGELIECGPNKNREWFIATLGGLGLTGLILSAEIQLQLVPGAWLESETHAFDCVDDYFSFEKQSEVNWQYRVAWIDCVKSRGRGLFMRANHVKVDLNDKRSRNPKKYHMKFTPPFSLINRWNLKLVNEIYYRRGQSNKSVKVQHYQDFFYPLDSIYEWNRLYGRKGFYQYQCVIPEEISCDAIKEIMKEISGSGQGSLLAVLKRFGDRESYGMLSFPLKGHTLALDFPNCYASTEKLFQRLDRIVDQAKGRVYLAKDARISRSFFEKSYPLYERFINYRDPAISSTMSKRLMG